MLDYDLGARGEKSLYEYLYQRIRDDIVSGAIGAEEHLPSKRGLAEHLGVSVVTVEGAYAQLVAEGYVKSRPRSGYFSARLPRQVKRGLPQDGRAPEPALAVSPEPRIDLASGEPGPEAARLWSQALRQALVSEPEAECFSPAPAQGTERLRSAIAAYLRQTRGMDVDPGCIVVGAGAQVLDTMIVQLLGRDLTYALEDPGYPRLTRLYNACGVQRVAHVPLDADGVQMAALEATAADVVHIMPSHQFPTGRVTSISRRYELLSWASAAQNRWIVEDDYDCEFRLAGRPVPPFAGMDAAGRVIYTNTFSKSLGSALRLAYMVLPAELVGRFTDELGFYSSTLSSVQQVALARLLETGDYERYVSRMRKRARERRDALVDALLSTPAAPCMRVEEADSGLHFVLAVECSRSEKDIAAALLAQGLRVAPLSDFVTVPDNAPQVDGLRRFVIQYASLDATAAEEAATLFADAIG
ncbi:MAG: PLP-dependent aminotransferase family protein [Coriobacteriia bacterium]|nr:PLP-dependent aminotransferase family protein [Coriobacteriia bacterium]